MKTLAIRSLAAAALFAVPTAAFAQDEDFAEPYIGVSAGYHDLGVNDDDDIDGFEIDDSGAIFGVFAGVDFPIGGALFAGVEGNVSIGTDAIDAEYGASARFGIESTTGAKYYVRGGYQEVDIDLEGALDLDLDDDFFDDIDTTEGDYLVGIGADVPAGPGAFRVNLDTISFDSFRATAGYAFTF